MARGLNRVRIIGHLGAHPERRSTPGGRAVTRFRVAVNRTRRDQDGHPSDETEWFRVVAFDQLGELASEDLAKGRACSVEGRLQSRTYTDRAGVERTAVEVVVSDLVLLGGRGEGGGARGGAPAPARDDVPF